MPKIELTAYEPRGRGHNLHDLKGNTFGSWLVIERDGSHPVSRQARWKCQCICGTEASFYSFTLLRERSTKNLSCGCAGISWRKRPYESTYNALVGISKTRNISINLTYAEFLLLTEQEVCFYCEGPVVWGQTQAYNLDRKDNTKGYSKDNVVVCCKPCNFGKGARYTCDEWLCMMKALVNFRKGKLKTCQK